MFTRLSNVWFNKVIATDASSVGQGVVITSAIMSSGQPNIEASKDPSLSSWKTIISSAWKRKEHINVLEIRAVITAVKWVISFPSSIRNRVAILCDSTVALSSITKGRSSSPLLLPRLRLLASYVLASGLQLYLSWIPSELNPADGPSRL